VNVTLSRERLRVKLFLYACMLVVFALPYSTRFTSYSMILLVIAWLIQGDIKSLLSRLKSGEWLLIGTPILYLVYLISISYSDNLGTALLELEKGIALLLLPLIFASSEKLSRDEINGILWSFIVSNLSLGIICLSYATFQFYSSHINIFFYHDLVGIFDSHATYYSMYLIFCIGALIFLYSRNAIKWQPRLVVIGVTIFLAVLIYLLGARSTVILFTFTSIVFLLVYINRSGNSKVGVLFLIGFLLLVIVIVGNNPHLMERITELKDYRYELSENHIEGYNGFTLRLAQWESSFSLIKKNLLLGLGIGDVQDQLQVVYQKNFLKYSYLERFNAHNEYIQTQLGVGLVGLTILLGSLVIQYYNSYKQKEFLYIFFIFLFSYCCITESMLHVQKGIVFYSLFSSLFYYHILRR